MGISPDTSLLILTLTPFWILDWELPSVLGLANPFITVIFHLWYYNYQTADTKKTLGYGE